MDYKLFDGRCPLETAVFRDFRTARSSQRLFEKVKLLVCERPRSDRRSNGTPVPYYA